MMKLHKYVRYLIVAICILLPLMVFDAVWINGSLSETSVSLIDTQVFPHDEVVDVKITIEEDVYDEMMENAINEEYVVADIDYNGYQFTDVAIRPKGNSSLKQVANSQEEDKRISFKVNLDYYVDDQNLYGITKLNLNNIFNDPSMMAEYISYEMLEELGAPASRTTYVALYINERFHGLYLAVEQVDEAFLEGWYGNSHQELYKPESGSGSDLKYISDDPDDYNLEPEWGSSNNQEIIHLMKVIADGGNLEEVFDVDDFLKYLAVSTITIHLDAYQGGMFHNYYLYNNNGVFQWITWDLNMSFNGFPKGGTDEQAVGFLIDEPVSGPMSGYPLIEAIFQNEAYVERYHGYMEELLDGYLYEPTINNKILSTYEMINSYVEIDPTAFYTYEQFEEALFHDTDSQYSMLTFLEKRSESIRQQLAGTIPSTNDGQGNMMGKGGKNQRGGQERPDNNQEKGESDNPPNQQANMKMGQGNKQGNKPLGNRPEGAPPMMTEEELAAMLPEGIHIQDVIALLPEGMDARMIGRLIPPDMTKESLQQLLPEGGTAEELVQILTERMQQGGKQMLMGEMARGGKGGGELSRNTEEPIDMQALITNIILAIVGLLGMFLFLRSIKKK